MRSKIPVVPLSAAMMLITMEFQTRLMTRASHGRPQADDQIDQSDVKGKIVRSIWDHMIAFLRKQNDRAWVQSSRGHIVTYFVKGQGDFSFYDYNSCNSWL